MSAPKARIGDMVHDEVTGRDAIVTDITGRRYLLRPPYGFGHNTWFAEDPDRLTLLTPREDRAGPRRS